MSAREAAGRASGQAQSTRESPGYGAHKFAGRDPAREIKFFTHVCMA